MRKEVTDISANFHFKGEDYHVFGKYILYPGVYYGPPENCYPDESEIEIEEIFDSCSRTIYLDGAIVNDCGDNDGLLNKAMEVLEKEIERK